MNRKVDVLEIRWTDAHSNDDWQDEGAVDHEPRSVVTVGMVVKRTKTAIIVATTVDPADAKHSETYWACTVTVPKNCIKNVRKIACLKL